MNAPATPEAITEITPLPIEFEWDPELTAGNPLDFPHYEMERDRHRGEAVRTGVGEVGGQPCVFIESNFDVFGGSMGLVVGERVSRAFRRATAEQLPVVATIRTGGARMQEGMLSLIQMPRVVSAIDAHSASGQLSLGLLRSPTTGGVFASWASLLDLRAAERSGTIGFAGPRVVEEMTGHAVPSDSHTAESAFAAGLVDAVVGPDGLSGWLRTALGALETPLSVPTDRDLGDTPSGLSHTQIDRVPSMSDIRSKHRPSGLEWAALLTESWTEIKGSDPSMRAGLATVAGVRCVVVAMDRHARGNASARQTPAAFILAQRAVDLAARLALPVLTLIDTPGAEPSPGSEAAGIAREIARTLRSLDRLPTGSVALCVGEGGSGGAMALAHADRFLMLEHSVFSVIGPEAAAVILWRDSRRADEATRALRIDARSLLDLGVADAVLSSSTSANALDQTKTAIAAALLEAKPGQRNIRIDNASHRWLDGPGPGTSGVDDAPERRASGLGGSSPVDVQRRILRMKS
ncbi:acetyl-CoA carboxylase carboxyl transferase subunit beta [Rhodococcus fascians]|nr:acetyl-CoA carboxylase carboxyl transferase subunit beta [Rhodococcus fascians]MBY4140924.1 acetyl-CoA carboxylase carboxyl transferase subunit beta [Rhodococcus fascians]MBY4219588.1 acetyl-CoA carboxylase carboxyl transferase subunit beta [Rhodococcus fascians]MBY4221897.1 acetyl-CoA carboxylase carboxyl transferase subunit beta [Rhodococcus fascians]MBY4233898.1 acetyl-CoA carboxylase carboxyl transferase subunit beta [Rhodococcus fascians]